jgi:hypothetical protein
MEWHNGRISGITRISSRFYLERSFDVSFLDFKVLLTAVSGNESGYIINYIQ